MISHAMPTTYRQNKGNNPKNFAGPVSFPLPSPSPSLGNYNDPPHPAPQAPPEPSSTAVPHHERNLVVWRLLQELVYGPEEGVLRRGCVSRWVSRCVDWSFVMRGWVKGSFVLCCVVLCCVVLCCVVL